MASEPESKADSQLLRQVGSQIAEATYNLATKEKGNEAAKNAARELGGQLAIVTNKGVEEASVQLTKQITDEMNKPSGKEVKTSGIGAKLGGPIGGAVATSSVAAIIAASGGTLTPIAPFAGPIALAAGTAIGSTAGESLEQAILQKMQKNTEKAPNKIEEVSNISKAEENNVESPLLKQAGNQIAEAVYNLATKGNGNEIERDAARKLGGKLAVVASQGVGEASYQITQKITDEINKPSGKEVKTSGIGAKLGGPIGGAVATSAVGAIIAASGGTLTPIAPVAGPIALAVGTAVGGVTGDSLEKMVRQIVQKKTEEKEEKTPWNEPVAPTLTNFYGTKNVKPSYIKPTTEMTVDAPQNKQNKPS